MTVYLTPTDDGDAIELSTTTFRKKVLPRGSIKYGDREIVFDDEYLADLAASYNEGAYDQVPFQLADESNRHTMLPERMKGECKSVEVKEDGLWGTFELSSDAAELVRANPKLGVSARIVEGYERSDGKTYKRALQHVLGTLDPRIPGMGAWEEIELSNGEAYTSSDVIDLSNSEYEEEGTVPENKKTEEPVAEKTPTGVSEEAAFAAVREIFPDYTDEQIRDLLAEPLTDEELAQAQAELDLEAEDETPKAEKEDQPKEEETPKAEKPKEEAPKAEKEKAGVALSNEVIETALVEDSKTVDLANQVAALQKSVADEKFSKERAAWVRDGVPPALVDLARDVLTAPQGSVIDLSNGVESKKVDAGEVIRKLLDASAGYIELAKDRGHTLSLSNEDNDETAKRADLISMWREQESENNPRKR